MSSSDQPAHDPDDQRDRHDRLTELDLLNSPPNTEFDRLMKLAARLLDVTLAEVTFIGGEREWIRSNLDQETRVLDTVRSVCARTVSKSGPSFISDFADNALTKDDHVVVDGETYRSYAGFPISVEGTTIGAFCVWDRDPREWSDEDRSDLELIANQVRDLVRRREEDRGQAYRSLKKSEERFRTIINNTQDYFTVLNEDGEVLYESPSIEPVLGFEQGDLVGESAFDYIHPDDLDEASEVFERVVTSESESFHRLECRHRDADSNWVWLEVTASSKYHSVWNGYLLSSRDISDRKKVQENLRERESQFREMADNIDEVFWMHDTEIDEVVYVSPAAEEIWGEPAEAFLGTSERWLNSILEADRERVEEHFREHFHDEFDIEYRIERPDGERRWIHDHGYPVMDDKGEVIRLVGTARDITERKQAERELENTIEELRETTVSRNYLDNIISTMPSTVMVVNDEGIIERVNSALCKLLEYSRDKLVGQRFEEVLADEDSSVLDDAFGAEDSPSIQNQEVRYLSSDGQTVPILFSASRLEDPNSGFSGFICVGLDISRRKEAQAALTESEQRFRQMAENIDEVIFMYSENWSEMLYVNSQYEEIWGQTIDELKEDPRAFMRGIHPDDRDLVREKLEKIAAGEEHTLEYRVNAEEDFSRSVISEATPIKNENGEVTRIVGTIRDITELKETQDELEQALDERANLLKEVHHRVKNNMQMISSILNLHERSDHRPPGRLLDECRNRITSMAMIHDMLYRSDNLAEISFDDYVAELVSSLIQLNQMPESSVEVFLDIAPTLELPLSQAIPCGLMIHELVSNAFQHGFSLDRENQLNVEMTEDAGHIILRVLDNGPGFPEDFDPVDSDSLGIEILQALSEYELGGTLTFENGPMTTVEVEFELDSLDS
jgi:PAS domain S-box-containing protein